MDLKNNQGILFENKKEKDTQPDFKGELNVDGKILRLAVWKKVSKNGNKYLSVMVDSEDKPKTKKEQENEEFVEDSIPFN